MLKVLKKLNSDLLFLVSVVLYLFARQWPFGGTLQTVADVLIVVALVLIVVNRFFK
ncbi:MAG: hypothetical protein A4E56_03165 [Pelotomaculum sp. PtaU1.Bin065]|nr:MAG: hypothetical protein A4E56_03165 [Pelotomaculum sp. PtaU1.Bin065]